jgi:anti-anti-sigma factor
MTIQQWSESIWVVTIRASEPGLSEDLQNVRREAARAERTPSLVVDLSAVAQINSSNLSQLLRLRKLAIDRDSKLRLAAPRNSVWAVFLTTGLDKVFEFAPDVGTALAGLQLGG